MHQNSPEARALQVQNGDVSIHVNIYGDPVKGEVSHYPVILCVHGWPEHSHSWRHQVKFFVNHGYTVATMDVRGYGNSSKPDHVGGYTLESLALDVACVAAAVSDQPVVLFGHDWGAPICYATTLRYPELICGVAGLSVPFTPYGDVAVLDVLSAIYAEQFFYILYFQKVGLVESEVEADMFTALRKIYFALSGDAPHNDWLKKKPANAGLLDNMTLPDKFPDWMSEEDFNIYVEAFTQGGFTGPVSRYRAMSLDETLNTAYRGKTIAQPACFIAGTKDAVRNYVPGVDGYADPGVGFEDFRGATLIEGKGHWIQQEAPAATNAALKLFMDSLAS